MMNYGEFPFPYGELWSRSELWGMDGNGELW